MIKHVEYQNHITGKQVVRFQLADGISIYYPDCPDGTSIHYIECQNGKVVGTHLADGREGADLKYYEDDTLWERPEKIPISEMPEEALELAIKFGWHTEACMNTADGKNPMWGG